jgi:hypothetical protein
VWWIPAHFQCLSRCFCRDGDGDIAGSDILWVIGRDQSAVAELWLVSAIRRRDRQEELVNGESGLRSARPVPGFTRLPWLYGEQAGTPQAWRRVSGAENSRRCLAYPAVTRIQAAGAEGISRDLRGDFS